MSGPAASDGETEAAAVDGSPGLASRAARGAAVTIGAQGGRMLLQLLSVTILARLLSPHDYGLVAIVVVLVGLGEIFRDFGLSSAAIQAKVLTAQQRSTLFWINTGLGAVLALGLFLAARPLADLYGQPELVVVAQVLSLTFLLNGMTAQYRADLTRRLSFSRLAAAEILAPALALAAAVPAALLGWGVGALIVQQLMQAGVLLLVMALGARWLPGLPRRDRGIRPLLGFGASLVGGQVVGYVSNNFDTALVGLRFGTLELGIYNRAFQLLMTPLSQVRAPLTTVAVPVLSRLDRDGDQGRFSDFVVRGQVALGYTVIPALAVVAALAEPLTALLLGDAWLAAAPILRLFALAGAFQMLAFVGYWVYVSRGLGAHLFRYTLISAAMRLVCVAVGSLGGLVGVAIGYAVAPALSWPISLWWLSRRVPLPYARLYARAGRVLVLLAAGSAVGYAVAGMVSEAPLLVELLVGVAAVLAVYGLACLLPAVRADLRDVVDLVRLLRAASSRSTASVPTPAAAIQRDEAGTR